jgi:hypothetical protein
MGILLSKVARHEALLLVCPECWGRDSCYTRICTSAGTDIRQGTAVRWFDADIDYRSPVEKWPSLLGGQPLARRVLEETAHRKRHHFRPWKNKHAAPARLPASWPVAELILSPPTPPPPGMEVQWYAPEALATNISLLHVPERLKWGHVPPPRWPVLVPVETCDRTSADSGRRETLGTAPRGEPVRADECRPREWFPDADVDYEPVWQDIEEYEWILLQMQTQSS